MKKITIDGHERVLFICDYKSFTEDEFNSGFDGPIYEYDPTRKMRTEIDLEKQAIEESEEILERRSREERTFINEKPTILEYYIDYYNIPDAIEVAKYHLKELKNTEWECSFVARLDDNENSTRSLIFISKKLGIRAYVRNIN